MVAHVLDDKRAGPRALTNGQRMTARLLRAAALEGVVGRVMSVDDMREWEARAPRTGTWRRAPPGARAAGDGRGPRLGRARRRARRVHRCVGSCLEGAYPPTFDPSDVPGRDLVEVIEGLVALTD